MTLAEKVDIWIADAVRRLHKSIDVRADIAKGDRPAETVRRSYGQKYRDRAREAAELRDATDGRR